MIRSCLRLGICMPYVFTSNIDLCHVNDTSGHRSDMFSIIMLQTNLEQQSKLYCLVYAQRNQVAYYKITPYLILLLVVTGYAYVVKLSKNLGQKGFGKGLAADTPHQPCQVNVR